DFMFGRRIKNPHRTVRLHTGLTENFCKENNLTICSICKNAVYQFSGKPSPPSRSAPAKAGKCLSMQRQG
ncbi:hypothetical protein ACCT25_37465, partial [Rhizobium ruizarguesonis]